MITWVVHGDMLVGGYSTPRLLTPEEQTLLKPPVVSRFLTVGVPVNSCHLHLLQVSTQVVAGTNYKLKVSDGVTCPGCWEVVVFVPLPSDGTARVMGTPTQTSCY
ncbi:Type-1 cystatin cysteine protease inhibitor [Fasciolopsis buskii]|uniref:Type-1 cystatin cysteine protease inhibitor n=1 Tax=Fasciolopsis buskii TaxID=27845 RepID=A0A8E0VJX3_9TREM|nr:Type-1 cystatin cysteine protease inhibitor [Fasciolopsis buski]